MLFYLIFIEFSQMLIKINNVVFIFAFFLVFYCVWVLFAMIYCVCNHCICERSSIYNSNMMLANYSRRLG